jgi:hypothetical protein
MSCRKGENGETSSARVGKRENRGQLDENEDQGLGREVYQYSGGRSWGDYALFLPLPLFRSLINSAIDLMGVFSSCTIGFDFNFDLDLGRVGVGEGGGILVDLIWSFDLVDLATTFFVLGLVFVLIFVFGMDLTVVVKLFDLVVWVLTGVRSSGSITISIEESAGDEGILIPIASTISISFA